MCATFSTPSRLVLAATARFDALSLSLRVSPTSILSAAAFFDTASAFAISWADITRSSSSSKPPLLMPSPDPLWMEPELPFEMTSRGLRICIIFVPPDPLWMKPELPFEMTSRDLGALVVLAPLDESFKESSTSILSASAFLDKASAFTASRAAIRSSSPSRPRLLLPAPDPQ